MVLTVKQKEELNLAVFEYLKNNSYQESASVFEIEAEVIKFDAFNLIVSSLKKRGFKNIKPSREKMGLNNSAAKKSSYVLLYIFLDNRIGVVNRIAASGLGMQLKFKKEFEGC